MQRAKPVPRYLNVLTDGKKHVAVCMRGDTLTKRSKSEWNASKELAASCTHPSIMVGIDIQCPEPQLGAS